MRKTLVGVDLLALIAGEFLEYWFGQRGSVKHDAGATRQILHYADPMHPSYKFDKPGIAPDCGMELVPVYADGGQGDGVLSAFPPGTVRISAEAQQNIGVRLESAEKRNAAKSSRILGRIAAAEDRTYKVVAGADGWLRDGGGPEQGQSERADDRIAGADLLLLLRRVQGQVRPGASALCPAIRQGANWRSRNAPEERPEGGRKGRGAGSGISPRPLPTTNSAWRRDCPSIARP